MIRLQKMNGRMWLGECLCAGLLLWAGTALAAGPVYWDWPVGRGFDELERDGLALDWQGHLTRGLDHRDMGPAGPEVFWELSADGQGGFLAGSGHGGELYQFDAKGRPLLLAQLDGEEIFSTLALPSGEILVGCGPDGQVYRIPAGGSPELVGKVEGGYVWDMARDPRTGEVWLAGGSPAAVYRWTGAGELERVHALQAQNCLAVTFLSDGSLLLGTQGPGLVYRLDPTRPQELAVLYQTAQDEVRQFLTGPDQQTFFLALNSGEDTSGDKAANGLKNGGMPANLLDIMDIRPESSVDRSALYRVDPSGTVSVHWTSDLDLMIAAYSPAFGWLAGGPLESDSEDAVIYQLEAPAQSSAVAAWPGGDVLDILVQPGKDRGDRILVAQAHPGGISELGHFDEGAALAQSPPLDGRQKIDWGRLTWTGQDPGGKLRWSVRGGESSDPDAGWSAWSSARKGHDHAIDLPTSRFLQWRVTYPRGSREEFEVTGVSISGWQENLPPLIRQLELEKVSDISLGGMMNGSDNVTQTYRSGLKAEFSRNSRADRRATGDRAAVTRPVRVFTWQGQDPNGDRLVYTLAYQRLGDQAWRDIVTKTEETIGAWDTSDVPDGHYRVRLTASDELDNPQQLSRQARLQTGPVQVDNTAPVIEDFRLEQTQDGFLVTLAGRDRDSHLAEAVVFLPDGRPQRLDPVDRICDSHQEKFSARIPWPQPGRGSENGPWQVRVEIRDMAGNLAIAEGDLPVERK